MGARAVLGNSAHCRPWRHLQTWLHMHNGCFPKITSLRLPSEAAATHTGVIGRHSNTEILILDTENWKESINNLWVLLSWLGLTTHIATVVDTALSPGTNALRVSWWVGEKRSNARWLECFRPRICFNYFPLHCMKSFVLVLSANLLRCGFIGLARTSRRGLI